MTDQQVKFDLIKHILPYRAGYAFYEWKGRAERNSLVITENRRVRRLPLLLKDEWHPHLPAYLYEENPDREGSGTDKR